MVWNHYDLRGRPSKGSGVRILRRKALGRSGVLRRIDVVRTDRPARSGQSASATPCRAVQISILRKPSCVNAWRRSSRSATGHSPTTGCRHSPERAQASGWSGFGAGPMQPGDQIARQERAVARHARDSGDVRARAPRPSRGPARMPASGPAKSGTSSATTGRPGVGKARRIAVGVENEPRALRREPFEDARENGLAADLGQRLVAAAHPPRKPAGQNEAQRGDLSRHAPPLCAGAWRFLPRRRRGPGRTRCGSRRRAR